MSIASTNYINFPISSFFLSFLTAKEVAALKRVSKQERERMQNLIVSTLALLNICSLEIRSPNYLNRHGFITKNQIKVGSKEYCSEIEKLIVLLNWIRKTGNEILDFLEKNQRHPYLNSLPSKDVEVLLNEKDDKIKRIKCFAILSQFLKCGNCEEMTAIAYKYLKDQYPNFLVEKWKILRKGDDRTNHVFCVVGKGELAIICDPWSQVAFPLKFILQCLKNTTTFRYKTVLTPCNLYLDDVEIIF